MSIVGGRSLSSVSKRGISLSAAFCWLLISGCSISTERSFSIDNFRATEHGLLFTLSRSEYRHFAMADHESREVKQAELALYEITPEQEQSGTHAIRVMPLLQQDALGWMNEMTSSAQVLVDRIALKMQPVHPFYAGHQPLVSLPLKPDQIQSPGYAAQRESVYWPMFGQNGFFYLRAATGVPTYVAAGRPPCIIAPAHVAVAEAAFYLSSDGRYVAVTHARGNVSNDKPKNDYAVELFAGCETAGGHTLSLAGTERLVELCVDKGEVWYVIEHDVYPRGVYLSARRQGAGEVYETAPAIDGRFRYAPRSFDCKRKQFIWLLMPERWEMTSVHQPVLLEIHRYDAVRRLYAVTEALLDVKATEKQAGGNRQ